MWVGDERLSHSGRIGRVRRYEVEHALGQASFVKDGSNAMHDPRRELRPLEYHGTSRRDGIQERAGAEDIGRIPVRQLICPIDDPAAHLPRRDGEDDAVGLAPYHRRGVRIGGPRHETTER